MVLWNLSFAGVKTVDIYGNYLLRPYNWRPLYDIPLYACEAVKESWSGPMRTTGPYLLCKAM